MFAETKCHKCKKIILGVETKEGIAGVCKTWWHGTYCFLGARLTKRAGDGATCPRCQGNLNQDGYCLACGYPFPPRH